MPRKPVKTTKNPKKPKQSAPVQKRVFEETIEILDSDDDFVIPNPAVRGIRQERICIQSPAVGPLGVRNLEIFDLEDSLDYEDSTAAAHSIDVELETESGLEVDRFEGGSSSNYSTLALGCETKSKDAWKGLMQLMQQNQKERPFTTSGSSKSLSFGKGKIKNVGRRQVGASSKGLSLKSNIGNINRTTTMISSKTENSRLNVPIPNIGSEEPISPPKKIKLEMNLEENSFKPSSAGNQSLRPDVKIPVMFLSPEEKAALAVAERLQKATIHSNPNLILSVLSEPLTFSSVSESLEKFDGNIVKANDFIPQVDPYAGQKKKTCPFYKKLPGTRFSVDAFNYGLIDGIDWYFLSHFHSDHYIGLTKKFCKTIICSPPTANLVKMKLYVEDTCIRRLRLNKPYIIDGVEVILIDANHCPGSVMFIFRLPNGITYLHTGDFRFTTDMLDNHFLQGLKIDNLYLDTTYCDPKYDFPPQIDSIVELISVVKRKIEFRPKTLIVCGSYLIGKERVYFSLAEALNLKVFANTDKRRVINALENPRFSAYLTENEESANIHVSQMFNIVPKFLSEYLASRSSKYTNIIGVKPSGWQFSFAGSGSSIKNHYNDTVTVIGVPYSEHSSFSELQQFVTATKPRKIQPTVNVGSESKRTAMMGHIDKWMQCL